ncbi:MAG: hypothetical protein ACI9W2_001439 [Gammaproteobacteria bacterium]|jgi:hypothetical protein
MWCGYADGFGPHGLGLGHAAADADAPMTEQCQLFGQGQIDFGQPASCLKPDSRWFATYALLRASTGA